MSSWIKHRRRGGETIDPIPLVTIRRLAIAFNTHFTALAKLTDMTRVSVFLDRDHFRIGFEFHKNSSDEDSYSLLADGGGGARSGGGRVIQPYALMNANPWIAAVGKIEDPRQRRFKPEWHSADKKWIISLCPAFEISVSHKSDIPSDVRGIYRYRRDDEIVYIGRGIVRSRLQAPERKEWDFDVIEYSQLQSETEQERWESYWLDQFVKQNGKLPLYNRISGLSS